MAIGVGAAVLQSAEITRDRINELNLYGGGLTSQKATV